jgi:hypothetical protein
LKQGDDLAHNIFNVALKYGIGELAVEITSTVFYKSVQLKGYADDANIMERMKTIVSKVYEELKERERERERDKKCGSTSESKNKSNGIK